MGQKLMLKGLRCMSPKCGVEHRSQAPGTRTYRRRKTTEHGIQLKEKQKARYIYGVLERQFRKSYEGAERMPGPTGDNLLVLQELRLDNVVYRLGFAESRNQARQLVSHGHFTLNGRKTDIPSCLVKTGDAVAVSERSRQLDYFKALGSEGKQTPPWLQLDAENHVGRVLARPSVEDLESKIDRQAIVGYYSR